MDSLHPVALRITRIWATLWMLTPQILQPSRAGLDGALRRAGAKQGTQRQAGSVTQHGAWRRLVYQDFDEPLQGETGSPVGPVVTTGSRFHRFLTWNLLRRRIPSCSSLQTIPRCIIAWHPFSGSWWMVAHRLQGRTFKASSGQLSNFKIRCLDFSSFGLLRRAFIIVNCRQNGQAFCYLHYLLLYSIVRTCIRTYIHTYVRT